jgi:hypothetical protein
MTNGLTLLPANMDKLQGTSDEAEQMFILFSVPGKALRLKIFGSAHFLG